MKVLSVDEMRMLDKKTIKGLGIPGTTLMENAGIGVVEMIRDMVSLDMLQSVCVVCGKGNNGGDGFVVARHLWNKGIHIDVVLLGEKRDVKGDARINLDVAEKLGIPIHPYNKLKKRGLRKLLNNADAVVDAIFGTGFKGRPEGIYRDVIQEMNIHGKLIFSIDVPSGVNANTGEVEGEAVFADATCTMAFIKKGLLLYPARYFVGELYVTDIGIPPQVVEEEDLRMELLEDDFVKPLLPVRFPYSHKGVYGRVGVIAGSPGFTGAACLTSEAALRAGAGLVYIFTPDGLLPIYETKLTEVIKVAIGGDAVYEPAMIEKIRDRIAGLDVLVIGPGIGTAEPTRKFVKKLLKEWDGFCVIDADGLNNIKPEDLKNSKGRWIITPHPGEFSRLTGKSIEDIEKDRIGSAREFSEKHEVIVVLKGVPTIIATHEGFIYINSTGNSGLSSGGSGDVLTGLIGGFLAQSKSPSLSAIAGVYIHGKAADIAMDEGENEYSLIAGDLLYFIGDAINSLEEEE